MSTSKISLERVKKLQKVLKKEKLGAMLIEDPVDLFYLTGMQMSLGHLIVKPTSACLFVDGRYLEAAQNQSAVAAAELTESVQIKFVKGVKTIGFNGDKTSYADFLHWKKKLKKTGAKLKSQPHLLRSLRVIKDRTEIEKMKKSAQFAYEAYEYIRKKIRPGITERQIARELEVHCLERGTEGMSFDPIIAFGANTALPHHHPGKTKCRENEIVLFDLGVKLDGYVSDMTRVDFYGKPDPKLLHLHEVNKQAQRKALSKCRPGAFLKDLDLAARSVMADAGLEKYFIHSLGHGVGLEVHEYPRIKFDGDDRNVCLEPGMAITIEPGLYLPGKGGVRYEDTVIITQEGYMNLYPE